MTPYRTIPSNEEPNILATNSVLPGGGAVIINHPTNF